MKKYMILTLITIQEGSILNLTKIQVRKRSHALKKTGKNWLVIAPVQFKRGETIGFEGDLPKNLAHIVERTDGKKPQVSEMMEQAAQLRSSADELKLKAEADGVTDEAKADAEADIARLTAEAETLETEAKARSTAEQ